MPKSVKEILIERESYDDLKGLYGVLPDIDSALSKVETFSSNTSIKHPALDESIERIKATLSLSKQTVNESISVGTNVVRGLTEAKQFEDDFEFPYFTHGLITCYQEGNRFVLTKDSHNGVKNYDTIVNMTKNDLKNIIKVCQEMIDKTKVSDESEEEKDHA